MSDVAEHHYVEKSPGMYSFEEFMREEASFLVNDCGSI